MSAAPVGGHAPPFRLVLVGWGSISRRVLTLLSERAAHIVPVAVALRPGSPSAADLPPGVQLITDPAELAALRPDLVVEAAGRSAVGPWGLAALTAGADFAPVSISALLDDALHDVLRAQTQNGGRLLYPSGAIGGMDVLRSAQVSGLIRVEHAILKPARAWKGTAAETLLDLDLLQGPTEFASGSVRQIAAQYPQNANSTVTTALAGLGPDRTHVRLVADPQLSHNVHQIEVEAASGKFSLRFENMPMPGNPKTSDMTALSLVTLIEAEAALRSRREARP